MIATPDYCQLMARYNAWQNSQVRAACEKLTEADLRADRGAFFGSIMATLNHLLWGDLIWMSRFDGGDAPTGGGIPDSGQICPTLAVWSAERMRMDARQIAWANAVTQSQLDGELAWYSGALGADVARPRAMCVVHMFNHQTHHRGQIHTMLTGLDANPGDTDLFIMPGANIWP